jgi:hypothetical protein
MEGLRVKVNSKGGCITSQFLTSLAAEIAALKAAKVQIDSELAPQRLNKRTEDAEKLSLA